MDSNCRAIVSTFVIVAMVLSLALLGIMLYTGEAQAQPYVKTWTVDDWMDNTVPPYTEGQLRWAIDQANSYPGGPEVLIDFNINEVYLNAELPALTRHNVDIDGLYNDTDRAQIRGWGAGWSNGLIIQSGGNDITNLRFDGFQRNGIWIHNEGWNTIEDVDFYQAQENGILITNDDPGRDSDENSIQSCYIEECSQNAPGPAGDRNDYYGVKIDVTDGGSSWNEIFGTTIVDGGNDMTGGGGGIGIFNSNDNDIRGCFIGTEDGFSDDGNEADGVVVRSGSDNNEIGLDMIRNYILDNGGNGVYIADSGTDGNMVRQSNIGVNLTGTGSVGNDGWGILVENGPVNTRIGEGNPLSPGRIGGNGQGGIKLYSVMKTVIQGNGIGTGFVAPFIELGNFGDGICVELSELTIIGSDDPLLNPFGYNTISDNEGDGVRIKGDSPNNAVLINGIFGNDDLGIDLDPAADAQNEPQGPGTAYEYPDSDEPNEFMNFPVINNAVRRTEGSSQANGTAIPDSTVLLFYSDDDPSGYGEGATYVGQTVADATGNWDYSASQLNPDFLLTATATDGFGNTSEYAANFLIGDEIPPQGSVNINGGDTITNDSDVTLTLTANDDYYIPSALDYQVSNYDDFHDAAWQNVPVGGVWQQDWLVLPGDGDKTVYYRVRNNWQESGAYNAGIRVKTTKPVGSVLINGGAAETKARGVALTLNVTDDFYDNTDCEMQISNYSDFRDASWQKFWGTKAWTLTEGNGTKTVYARYRDPLGNTSNTVNDTIKLVGGEPVTGPIWYLAEGSTAWGFSCYISIQNTSAEDANAKVTYMLTNGDTEQIDVGLPAESQTTINPADTLGQADFSTKIECIQERDIAVDRTMYWTGEGAPSPDGHCSIGVTSPAKTWYLPEGSSAWGFESWLLLQNPNATDATATLTYMIEGSGPVTVTKTVPANSRQTYNMEEEIGNHDASVKVEADQPVMAERAMYRNNKREGHDSIGTTSPEQDYYLAEGTTAWGFTSYVLIQNSNDTPADVTVTYMTPDGPSAQAPFQMPANSRKTIRVNDVLPNTDFSTKVHGSQPIIAERAMYWGEGTPLGEACHDSIGLAEPHTTFYLPDGQTTDGRETWTLVQNPNDTDVAVRITYMTPDGTGNVTLDETIPANSRRTFSMAEAGVNGRAAILVTCTTADKKIMVERAMYWNDRGAGTDTIGGFAD